MGFEKETIMEHDFHGWYHKHEVEVPAGSADVALLLLSTKIIYLYLCKKATKVNTKQQKIFIKSKTYNCREWVGVKIYNCREPIEVSV